MSLGPWVQNYEPDVPTALEDEPGTFHALLHAAAAGAPGWPAITSMNRTVGYSELEALSGRVAAALLRDGVRPGSHVVVALQDGLPLASVALGVMRVGAVVVPVDPEATAQELGELVRRHTPAVVVATNGAASGMVGDGVRVVAVRTVDHLPWSLRLAYRLGSPRAWRSGVRTPKGTVRWRDWLEKAAPDEEVDVSPDMPALAAAGVKAAGAGGPDIAADCTFSHSQLVAGAMQLRAWLTDAMPGDDTWLMLTSLSSPYGLVAGLGAAMLLRSRLVLVPGGESTDVLDALRYLRPAYVAADADSIRALVSDPLLSRPDFLSVRALLVSDPISALVASQFEQATGLAPCQGFSTTRSAGLVTCNPVNGQRTSGSVGLPMPDVQVRLVDDRGELAGDGDTGQLELRGPNLACTDDWHAAGVLARLDNSGYVYLIDGEDGGTRAADLRGGST